LQGGRSFSFRSGDTDYSSEEELTFASQQFSERMHFQREFNTTPSDTSQVSTSSLSLYTPDSDLNLFDQSFSTSLVEPDAGADPYNGEQHRLFQDGPQFPSDSTWFPGSRGLANAFPNTPGQEKVIWGSLTEAHSVTALPLPFQNFNIPPQTTLAAPDDTQIATDHNQTFDTSKVRPTTRNRGSTIRKSSHSSERRLSEPKLRTADHARTSTSPTIAHPNTNLKRAHNMVEKQYRNRLNSHFASLLAKIPLELAASTGLDNIGGGKNVSKAETLVLAERYIKMLQDEERELLKKNKRLEEDFERLKSAWIKSGGVLMP
jgi:Helix-loop-helix DNA-binding domain